MGIDKKIIMFGLAFTLLQVTNVGVQAPGYAQATDPQDANPEGGAPGYAPVPPRGDSPDASGSSYNLNQPVTKAESTEYFLVRQIFHLIVPTCQLRMSRHA
jgi:hypothetical protein